MHMHSHSVRDGRMEIVAKTVKDPLGSYTDYTLHVGDTSLLVTRREFEELRELIDEVLNDAD